MEVRRPQTAPIWSQRTQPPQPIRPQPEIGAEPIRPQPVPRKSSLQADDVPPQRIVSSDDVRIEHEVEDEPESDAEPPRTFVAKPSDPHLLYGKPPPPFFHEHADPTNHVGTKRLPGTYKLHERTAPRVVRTYSERLKDLKAKKKPEEEKQDLQRLYGKETIFTLYPYKFMYIHRIFLMVACALV